MLSTQSLTCSENKCITIYETHKERYANNNLKTKTTILKNYFSNGKSNQHAQRLKMLERQETFKDQAGLVIGEI